MDSIDCLRWVLNHADPEIDLHELIKEIPKASKDLSTSKWLKERLNQQMGKFDDAYKRRFASTVY